MDEAPRTNLRSSRRLTWMVPVVALAGLGGYAVFRLAPHAAAPPPPSAPAPEGPAAEEPVQAATATPDADPARPEDAPSLLEGASAQALYRTWLAGGDLVHRWVVITANLAQGESPRRALPFLAPPGAFSAVPRGDRLAIAPQSYARYDAIADAIATIDPRAIAMAYRRLHGPLESAYRMLGYPAGSLDRATARALRRVAEAPLPSEDVLVEQQDGLYVFADARLEQLPDVEKHLLRIGPRNERILQAKARELLAALGLSTVASGRP